MHQRSLQFILVLFVLMPAALLAQNDRLNGTWIAPTTKGNGPGFLAFTFVVNGDTFTGTMSDTGRRPERFTDGKIENGHISFSFPKEQAEAAAVESSYTGTLKDDKHLELVSEFRTSGGKMIRKPGTSAPSNTLEGEWVPQAQPGRATYVFHVQGDKLTGEVRDRFGLYQNGEALADVPETHPLTDGTVHGNEFSFGFINIWHNPMTHTGTVAGDHLVMNSSVRTQLHAVRLAEVGPASAVSAGGAAAAPTAASTATGMHHGNMDAYRTLAQSAMEAVKKNDMATASRLCQELERKWDDDEQALHKSSPDAWEQIDHAMDQFIHPIMRSGGSPPNAAALDAVYRDYLNKLKLAG